MANIAFLHPFLFRYARGIERYTLNLARALADCGITTNIVTWRWDNTVEIELLDPRVRVHTLPTSHYFAAQAVIPFYVSHLLRARYDFVWIFFAGYGEAETLALLPKQKFGIVLHYPYAQVPHRYQEFRRYDLQKRAAEIVAVSQYVAGGAREYFGRANTVIPHGVDTTRFAPNVQARARLRQSLGIAPDAPLLVTAAALEERKGIQHVITALPQVRAQFPNLTYLVLGEGAYREALVSQIEMLSLNASVRMLGAQTDVTPFYQAADMALILAQGEASSLTALEAMACELPVIAAQQPPFDEIVTRACGILVNETDPPQVAATISALLQSSELRMQMGKAGRARVQNHFTWERAAEQYTALMQAP